MFNAIFDKSEQFSRNEFMNRKIDYDVIIIQVICQFIYITLLARFVALSYYAVQGPRQTPSVTCFDQSSESS